MDYIFTTLGNLVHQTAFFNLTVGNFSMIFVACFFLYLAIGRGYEPLLLVPIAFGMLLVNLYPDIMKTVEEAAADGSTSAGLLHYFFLGDEWGIWPSLIFLGVGAMTDFGLPVFFWEQQHSLVFSLLILVPCVLGLKMQRLQQFPLSAVRTARHPYIWPVSWDRHILWDRLP